MIGMREAPHLCVVMALAWWSISLPAMAEERLTFERDERPILKEYCLGCHGGNDSPKGKLDLRLKRFAEHGGESGPALVAGKPEESYLLERLRDAEMPSGEKRVPREKITVIERWIAQGAATLRPEPQRFSPGVDISPEERAHSGRSSPSAGQIRRRSAAKTGYGPRSMRSCWRNCASTVSPSHPRPTGGR